MPVYLTPGVYFERTRPADTPSPLRTDVAGFVGLAERGPLHRPQRLTSWHEFQQVFGGFLPYSNLAYAVRAFFENGGRACWVVRVAHAQTASSAGVAIPDARRQISYTAFAANPGAWGGQKLEISLQSVSLGATRSVVFSGLPENRLGVESVSGFQVGSWVRLVQTAAGPLRTAILKVAQVDVLRGVLLLAPLSADLTNLPEDGPQMMTEGGFLRDDRENPISVQTLEFDLLVWEEGQVAERFAGLAPGREHPRFVLPRVNNESRLVRLQPGPGSPLPGLPWRGRLQGGANGLRDINVFDYTGLAHAPAGQRHGLEALAEVDEVGLLVMPDLVLRPQPLRPSRRAPRGRIDPCALDNPTVRVSVTGTLRDAVSDDPLRGVSVKANDGLSFRFTESAADGRFILTDLLPGNIELIFNIEGYQEWVTRTSTGGDLRLILLTPLDLPPALDDEDIFLGQMAMVMQCERLRDRFALLDPPPGPDGRPPEISKLQAWRARFDTQFAALYYPWLVVRDPLQPSAPGGRVVPPSGHVAGIYAATDLSEGVFRPPANRPLAFVEDVSASVNDVLQGVLNPVGINVIRAFPGQGIRIYGARTMSSNTAWRFVNVRRLMSLLEETLYDRLQWAVFEPNGRQLWYSLRLAITAILDDLWRRGAFIGDTAEEAYQVRCDATTSPPEVQDQGQVIAEILVAPTVPYEFIVLRLGVSTDELLVSEV